MAYRNLQDFIKVLKDKGELIEIDTPVSSELEITEITDRASKEQGLENKALLFNNVKDYDKTFDMPVLTNAFGSYRRMAMALGVDNVKDIAKRIEDLTDLNIPDSLLGKVSMLPKLAEVKDFFPKVVSSAECQEVVVTEGEMLDKLPILKCWSQDAGEFITLPLVFTKNPNTGSRNVGMYRLQKYDNQTTGMHWHKHHDGAKNFALAKGMDKKCEVAVALGCDPAITYSATAPVPSGIDEMIFAGFLRKKPVELVKCKTVDIEVPACAEIVLEGYVDLHEGRIEGPFGDHTGYYSEAGEYPVFHITAMTHKKNPIYPATVVGRPPQEDCYMAKATEQIFLPVLQKILPEVVDLNLPLEGVFHNCAIVSIKKSYAAHATKVMNAMWGLGQMMLTKFIVVTDEDVDVHNLSEVTWKVFNHTDPSRDCIIQKGPLDVLDHSCDIQGFGGKMGIDATRKWESEGFTRGWPEEIVMDDNVKARVDKILNVERRNK